MQQLAERAGGIPPSHPNHYHQRHARSSSQPDFFSSLPPLGPAVEMPPSRLHRRRSRSDAGNEEMFRDFLDMGDSGDIHCGGGSENEADSNHSKARHFRGLSVDGLPMSDHVIGGEFSSSELEKIMANEKLAEIALTDPRRVKRILANRQSAARSKQRKMHYISELEHKVKTLQAEATTLSAQLTLLQRDSAGLNNLNNELKIRLQAMEQQARLKDALNEALGAEVRRLKFTNTGAGETHLSTSTS